MALLFPPLYQFATGAPVAATQTLTLTLARVGETTAVRRTQSAAAWARDCQSGLITEGQLLGCGYRLAALADAQRVGYAAVEGDIQEWEAHGWFAAHRYLGGAAPEGAGPDTGWAWWQYSGVPPQVQGRVTDVLAMAVPAVAAGAIDAWPLPCATLEEWSSGVPATQRSHTVAQLQAVQRAGQAHLVNLGEIRDEAVHAIQAAGTAASVDAAVELARVRWARACAAPTDPAGPEA